MGLATANATYLIAAIPKDALLVDAPILSKFACRFSVLHPARKMSMKYLLPLGDTAWSP
jgi:hypothetical protein